MIAAAVAIATFVPVLGFEFVYDDHWTIVRNKYLNWPLAPVLRASFSGAARGLAIPDGTRPLMILSNWLDRHVFGLAPEGHHLHSLAWYVLCSVGAVFASFAITRNRRIAFCAALFFAVSPMHAEVVASINYREDLLSSFAVLVAVSWLFWPRGRESIDGAVVSAGVLGLGLLAKESTAAIVPIVAGLSFASPVLRKRLHGRTWSLIALGVVLVIWGAWRAWLRAAGRDDVPLVRHPPGLAERLLRACRYEARAVIDTVWPMSWAPDHPAGATPHWTWCVLLLLLFVGAGVACRKAQTRVIGVGLVWTMAAPLVTSPLLGPINERTDRYLFLSVLGAAWVWVGVVVGLWKWAASRIPPGNTRTRAFRAAQAAGILGLLGLLLEARMAANPWRSDAELWRRAVEREPASANAWTGLSRQLFTQDRLDEADLAIARAIALDPNFLTARLRRAYHRLARGDVHAAREQIAEIEAMGGFELLGMRAARQCAALDPDNARRCVRGETVHSTETQRSDRGVNGAPPHDPAPGARPPKP